jgi:tetratricopeptide (TPR) repeat protein
MEFAQNSNIEQANALFKSAKYEQALAIYLNIPKDLTTPNIQLNIRYNSNLIQFMFSLNIYILLCSTCYAQLGDLENAENIAAAALTEDPDYVRVLWIFDSCLSFHTHLTYIIIVLL